MVRAGKKPARDSLNPRVHRLHLFAGDLHHRVMLRRQRDGFIERQLARLRVRDSAARDQHQHCRRNRSGRSRPGTTLLNQNVENGNYHKSEEHRTYQSKGNRAAQRRPHARAGENHGCDADRRRHGRQEDGPQSAFAGFDGGLFDRDAFLHALLV